MFYFILLVFVVVAWFGMVVVDAKESGELVNPAGFFGTIPVAIVALPWLIAYTDHAVDIATIQEQHRVIQVYKDRIESLSERLDKLASSGVKNDALLQMNADTPVGSMVSSITRFESQIADAEEKRARAYRSIAARKIGLTKSVTWFFDEP